MRLRQLVHATDPETRRSGAGAAHTSDRNGIMVGIFAHKTCVSVWFHKGGLGEGPKKLFEAVAKDEDKGMRVYKLKEGDTIDEEGLPRPDEGGGEAEPGRREAPRREGSTQEAGGPPELEAVLQKDEMARDQWTRFNWHAQEGARGVDHRREEGGDAQAPHRPGLPDDPRGRREGQVPRGEKA